MDIRELTTVAERRDAVPILCQLWPDREPAEVLAWTGADDYHLFGRVDGDALVGVAGLRIDDFLHHARHAWLYDFVVDESRRGEGHGTALLEFVESWARDRDCEYVALASPLEGTDVHEYYADQGFDRWGYVLEKPL